MFEFNVISLLEREREIQEVTLLPKGLWLPWTGWDRAGRLELRLSPHMMGRDPAPSALTCCLPAWKCRGNCHSKWNQHLNPSAPLRDVHIP